MEKLLGIIRHILTIGGSVLAMSGIAVDGETWQTLSGAVITIASIIWSIAAKPSTPVNG